MEVVAGAPRRMQSGASPTPPDTEDRTPHGSCGRLIRVLSGHTSPVVALSTMCDLLASGSYDMSVRVWVPSTGACLRCLEGHGGTVWAMAAVGDLCISGSADNTIKVWGTTTDVRRPPLSRTKFTYAAQLVWR